MRVHHLNCGTCCPAGGRLFDGHTNAPTARLVCHCRLIETDAGLVLVDTGYRARDVAHPRERLAKFFIAPNRPRLAPEETAVAQVRRLGFDPADVRHIVVSHLDFDHAGGIEDFPRATSSRSLSLFQTPASSTRLSQPTLAPSCEGRVATDTPVLQAHAGMMHKAL